jgi:CTP:molybdopterin cytidylyltransferase MocA
MKPIVAALLLAAGLSRRMGTCKQLLPLEGKTVIARCLEPLLAGGIDRIVVVVGPHGDAVARAAREYPVTIVYASDPEGDMAASVRAGRDALLPEITGVLITPCDHPLVSSQTVALLASRHQAEPARIIIPTHNGGKGHPTLFPRCILDELVQPLTLRDLVRDTPRRLEMVEVADQGVCLDMDTPAEYQKMVALCQAETLSGSAPAGSSGRRSA